jgi:hypothetical protein
MQATLAAACPQRSALVALLLATALLLAPAEVAPAQTGVRRSISDETPRAQPGQNWLTSDSLPAPASRFFTNEEIDDSNAAPPRSSLPDPQGPRGAPGEAAENAPIEDNSPTLPEPGLLDAETHLKQEKKEEKSSKWYDKISIRGYSQIRFGRALRRDPAGAPPILFGDHSISEDTGTFSIRRARLIISENVSDHLLFYFQSDFANNPADDPSDVLYAQIRDLYADIYLDTDKVNRLRIGQSKIPWGFEEMQSSGNRVPLDRSDAIDSGDTPNQRDLGLFYYWTPVAKQELLKDLVDDGLKGTGNYGIFALGVYNGQGGSTLDQNQSLHGLARLTYPVVLDSGQVVETSIQGFIGKHVVNGAAIRPLGVGPASIPAGVGPDGLQEERLAATFVWYPQPFGFQTEWNVGRGPGLNAAQTAVVDRPLDGGYAMVMYKLDTANHGVVIPYGRFQHYRGGYRSIANAPYGTHNEYDVGFEWQMFKDLELVTEYGFVDGVNFEAFNEPGVTSYRNFRGQVLRCQLQVNY